MTAKHLNINLLATMISLLVVLSLTGCCPVFKSAITPATPVVPTRTALELVETLYINSNGETTYSSTPLEAGKLYSIVVTGVYTYRSDEPLADAQSAYDTDQKRWVAGQAVSIDDQPVTAGLANPDKHQYVFYVVGRGRIGERKSITFRINDSYFGDNKGKLQAQIYLGYLAQLP